VKKEADELWRLATVNGERVPESPRDETYPQNEKPKDWNELDDLLRIVIDPIIDEMWERIVVQPPDNDCLAIRVGIERATCESARVSAEFLVEKFNALHGCSRVAMASWGIEALDVWAEECGESGTKGGA